MIASAHAAHAIPLVLLFAALGACTTTTITAPGATAADPDAGVTTDDDGGPMTNPDGGPPITTSTGTWSVVAGVSDDIKAIWGSGANDVWYTTAASEIFHYDGTAWTMFASGGPPLGTIWGTSKTNVYAAGSGTFVHFDGSGWSNVSPQVTTGTINAIGGTGSSDVWIVGQYIGSSSLRHFNGSEWDYGDDRDPPSGSSSAVLRAVTGDWVLGDSGTLLHWNGASWDSQGESFGPTLYGAWGVNDSNSWFVGGSNTIMAAVGGAVEIESDHLVGSFPLADDPTQALYGVWGSSASDVWAVGSKGHIVHRDASTTWSLATSPTTSDLHCVWGSGPDDVWVGGSGVLLHYSTDTRGQAGASDP